MNNKEIIDAIEKRYLYLKKVNVTQEKILEILSLEFELTKNKINWLIFSFNSKIKEALERENKYKVFWNPDENQKFMIDWFDEDFREKMIDYKLKYTKYTIELEINWEKIVLDKEQPIQEKLGWQDSINAIDSLDWRRWVDRDLLKELVTIFEWKAEVIWLSSATYYWYSPNNASDTNFAWTGSFNGGYVSYTIKTDFKSTICIHN